jgi:hypothetical protein
MDNCLTLSRILSVYSWCGSLIILLQSGATLCCADFEYATYCSQFNAINVSWALRLDVHCPKNGPYNIAINRCDGELHNLLTPISDNSGHIEVMINHSLCGSRCTVQFQGSEVCTMFLNISTDSKLRLLCCNYYMFY